MTKIKTSIAYLPCIIALLMVTSCSTEENDDNAKSDRELIQGTWEVVSSSESGREVPVDGAAGSYAAGRHYDVATQRRHRCPEYDRCEVHTRPNHEAKVNRHQSRARSGQTDNPTRYLLTQKGTHLSCV